MKLDRFIRSVLALLILLVFIIGIAAIVFLTESALNVLDRLLEGPRIFLYGYAALITALFVAALWLIWRLLVRRRSRPAARQKPASLTREEIEDRLRSADESGADVTAARAELAELAARQVSGAIGRAHV